MNKELIKIAEDYWLNNYWKVEEKENEKIILTKNNMERIFDSYESFLDFTSLIMNKEAEELEKAKEDYKPNISNELLEHLNGHPQDERFNLVELIEEKRKRKNQIINQLKDNDYYLDFSDDAKYPYEVIIQINDKDHFYIRKSYELHYNKIKYENNK